MDALIPLRMLIALALMTAIIPPSQAGDVCLYQRAGDDCLTVPALHPLTLAGDKCQEALGSYCAALICNNPCLDPEDLDNLDLEFCVGHAYGEPWDPSENCAWSHFCLKVGDTVLYGCKTQ